MAGSGGISSSAKLLLAAALSLILLLAAVALAPAQAFPPRVFYVLDRRREAFLTALAALGLGIAVVFVVVEVMP
jgi:uncharacterized membrane protein